MISYVTCVKDRLTDFRLTFNYNYGVIDRCKQAFQMVVVDWACSEGTADWVYRIRGSSGLRESRILILKTTARDLPWSFSRAKNLGHKASSGDVIVNLDGDNLLTENWVNELQAIIEDRGYGVPFLGMGPGRGESDAHFGGAGGRIAIQRTALELLHGYDEEFVGYGAEDLDIIIRGKNAGFELIEFGKEEDYRFLATPGALMSDETKERKTREIQANAERVREAQLRGKSQVNLSGWGEEVHECL